MEERYQLLKVERNSIAYHDGRREGERAGERKGKLEAERKGKREKFEAERKGLVGPLGARARRVAWVCQIAGPRRSRSVMNMRCMSVS